LGPQPTSCRCQRESLYLSFLFCLTYFYSFTFSDLRTCLHSLCWRRVEENRHQLQAHRDLYSVDKLVHAMPVKAPINHFLSSQCVLQAPAGTAPLLFQSPPYLIEPTSGALGFAPLLNGLHRGTMLPALHLTGPPGLPAAAPYPTNPPGVVSLPAPADPYPMDLRAPTSLCFVDLPPLQPCSSYPAQGNGSAAQANGFAAGQSSGGGRGAGLPAQQNSGRACFPTQNDRSGGGGAWAVGDRQLAATSLLPRERSWPTPVSLGLVPEAAVGPPILSVGALVSFSLSRYNLSKSSKLRECLREYNLMKAS